MEYYIVQNFNSKAKKLLKKISKIAKNKEIIPCSTESQLLAKYIETIRDIDPDILIGYYSDYFDIPYLYNRRSKVLGEDLANALSPIQIVKYNQNKKIILFRF